MSTTPSTPSPSPSPRPSLEGIPFSIRPDAQNNECLFWRNPFTDSDEEIARFTWPTHPTDWNVDGWWDKFCKVMLAGLNAPDVDVVRLDELVDELDCIANQSEQLLSHKFRFRDAIKRHLKSVATVRNEALEAAAVLCEKQNCNCHLHYPPGKEQHHGSDCEKEVARDIAFEIRKLKSSQPQAASLTNPTD